MNTKKVTFSKLLKIFELFNKPAFIIQLDFDGKKENYISYRRNYVDSGLSAPHLHYFESLNETKHKEHFCQLSNSCLMSVCTDSSFMLYNSPVTHFNKDCSSLINASYMFASSHIKEFTGDLPNLEIGSYMFNYSNLECFNSELPKIKEKEKMFNSNSDILIKNQPYLFL